MAGLRGPYANDLARAQQNISGHRCTPKRSRSFDFRTPGTWAYAFALTWTPGTLTIAGDCGEMIVTHYHALADLQQGLKWAAGSDYDYLLGKTDKRQVYDADKTADFIIEQAEADAIRARRSFREELWWWKLDQPRRQDFSRSIDWYEAAQWWLDHKPRLEWAPASFAQRQSGERDPPEGWELWGKIHAELGYGREEDIFKRSYRETLEGDLRARISAHHDAADLCCRLGFDDYYGSESWGFGSLQLVTCLQMGAAWALQELEAERAYTWTAASATELAAAFPRAFAELSQAQGRA